MVLDSCETMKSTYGQIVSVTVPSELPFGLAQPFATIGGERNDKNFAIENSWSGQYHIRAARVDYNSNNLRYFFENSPHMTITGRVCVRMVIWTLKPEPQRLPLEFGHESHQ